MAGGDQYWVVSPDSHAGAAIREYKACLEKCWHEALTSAGSRFGPLVNEVAVSIADCPAHSFSPVFETEFTEVVPSW